MKNQDEALYNSDPASFRVVEMLENIPDNFISVDTSWTITYVNRAFEKLYKVNRWNVINKNLWTSFPNLVQQQFAYYRHLNHSMSARMPTEFEEYSPSAGIWLYLKTYPVTNGLAIYSRDITIEKELRDKAHSDAMNLATIIDYSEDLIWSVDNQLRMLFGNKAFRNCFESFAGFYPAEGQYLLDKRVPPVMRYKWKGSYERALKGETFTLTEHWVQKQVNRYMEINFNPIYTAEGHVIGANCFVKDVTLNEANARRIREQNEKLRQVAWLQSHKMRRPVANLLGIIELMKIDFPGLMKNEPLMTALHQSVVQIDEITREIVLATKELQL